MHHTLTTASTASPAADRFDYHALPATSPPGAKGRVGWRFGGSVCFGSLLPAQETKSHCFARTHKGNTKTLAKGKDYWWMIVG